MNFALKAGLLCGVCLAAVATLVVWLLPVEAIQGWRIGFESSDPYAQFEAAGQAEALTWLARTVLPVATLLLLWSLWNSARVNAALSQAAGGLARSTDCRDPERPHALVNALRTWGLRAFLAGWVLLFLVQSVDGVLQRGRDWAYFRFRSGGDVLPNISFENRDVIRYLRQATPETARILVGSDQSVFFLSYYLLPRRIFHKVHPEAEFVIPQPGQQRPLTAYRLSDLSAAEIASIHPDFVLEYYETPTYNDPARRLEDANWVAFWRSLHGSTEVPPYFVSLRRVAPGATP